MSQREDVNSRGGVMNRTFASALHSLKQEGCSLLVVGAVPDSISTTVCQSMLGDPDFSTRRRLFVATDRKVSTACDFLSTAVRNPDPERVKVLSFSESTRHATTQSPSTQAHIPIERVASSELSDLGIAISETIADFEAQAGTLDPAEVRVCVDSLAPLIEYDRERLFHFLDLLNGRIRNVNGMGHMHLQVDRDSEIVHLLEPLFDAVVELRQHNGEAEQRWYLQDSGLRTGWISRT